MNAALLVVLIVGIGVLLVQTYRVATVLEHLLRESDAERTRLRRTLRMLAKSIPHCHACALESKERERARSREQRERERREKGITVVSVVCPVCQAEWEVDVDRGGEIVTMQQQTPGSICLSDSNYDAHQGPLFAAIKEKYATERK